MTAPTYLYELPTLGPDGKILTKFFPDGISGLTTAQANRLAAAITTDGGHLTSALITDDIIEPNADPRTLVNKLYVDARFDSLTQDYSYLLPGSVVVLVRSPALPQPTIPASLPGDVIIEWQDTARGLPTPTPQRAGDRWRVPKLVGSVPDATLAYTAVPGSGVATGTAISVANNTELSTVVLNSQAGVTTTSNPPPLPVPPGTGRSYLLPQTASTGSGIYVGVQSGKSGIGALSNYSDAFWVRLNALPAAGGGAGIVRAYANDTEDNTGQAYNIFINASGHVFVWSKVSAVAGLNTNGTWSMPSTPAWWRIRIVGVADATTPYMRLVVDSGGGSAAVFDQRAEVFASGNEVTKRQAVRFGWLGGSGAGGTTMQIVAQLGAPTPGQLLAPSYVAP